MLKEAERLAIRWKKNYARDFSKKLIIEFGLADPTLRTMRGNYDKYYFMRRIGDSFVAAFEKCVSEAVR